MHPRAAALIRLLDLTPHPEGGYYREVFRSPRMVRPSDSTMERASITTIYFLLVAGRHSRWHGMAADEIWHYDFSLLADDPEEQARVRDRFPELAVLI